MQDAADADRHLAADQAQGIERAARRPPLRHSGQVDHRLSRHAPLAEDVDPGPGLARRQLRLRTVPEPRVQLVFGQSRTPLADAVRAGPPPLNEGDLLAEILGTLPRYRGGLERKHKDREEEKKGDPSHTLE